MNDWKNDVSASPESVEKMLSLPKRIDTMTSPRVIKTHQMLGTLHPDLLNTCKVNKIYKQVFIVNNQFYFTAAKYCFK